MAIAAIIWRSRGIARIVCIFGMLSSLGCAGTTTQGNAGKAPEGQRTVASRPAGHGDQLSVQAGSMAEEDARRTRPAIGVTPRERPDPVRREPRSPVDQPRLR